MFLNYFQLIKDIICMKLSVASTKTYMFQLSFMYLLAIVTLQYIAYYTSVHKKCDIYKLRNLVKSVTVE